MLAVKGGSQESDLASAATRLCKAGGVALFWLTCQQFKPGISKLSGRWQKAPHREVEFVEKGIKLSTVSYGRSLKMMSPHRSHVRSARSVSAVWHYLHSVS